MLLYYIRGQRGVDLDGKCKKKNMTRGLQSGYAWLRKFIKAM